MILPLSVPALATGNAAVLKPSEDACLTPLAFCAIAADAGLPAGALHVVTGLAAEAGNALTHHWMGIEGLKQ